MKLEDQVCNLQLSKRLNELGVRQESLFYWWRHKSLLDEDWLLDTTYRKEPLGHENLQNFICISAFTVAELGIMIDNDFFLPHKLNNDHWFMDDEIISLRKKWQPEIYEKTEANARAKMLIYLIENKLINLGEPNE